MHIELTEATPQHAPAIGRIFFEAFKDIMDRHGLPLDIPSEEVATAIMTARIGSAECYGIVALVDGQVAAGNFYSRFDDWAGVGPMIVDPAMQGHGLGRRLMQAVIDHAAAAGYKRIRLLQDAINMTSMSLYTSLGFTVTEPIVLLQLPDSSAPAPDSAIRPLTPADADLCGQLSAELYGLSRTRETAYFIKNGPSIGVIPVGLQRDGELIGYAVPGFFGHGVARNNDDLLTLISGGAALSAHPATRRWLCPSRNGDLFRQALARRHRAVRGLHAMAMGPWETPSGSWFCSIEG
jgi:predicted N-acetyltransferase YhbS